MYLHRNTNSYHGDDDTPPVITGYHGMCFIMTGGTFGLFTASLCISLRHKMLGMSQVHIHA